MVDAYSDKESSYKYQYSVGVALHGTDLAGYFGPATANQGPDFERAFMTIWGNFIKINDPSISNEIANGASSNMSSAENPASSWPPFSVYAPYQINLNETGGTSAVVPVAKGVKFTENISPGLSNNFNLVNAYSWEAGRGMRCDFWRSMAALVPE